MGIIFPFFHFCLPYLFTSDCKFIEAETFTIIYGLYCGNSERPLLKGTIQTEGEV